MKKRILGAVAFLLFVSACYASERAANTFKTHKLATNSVLVSCNDEREPVAKKLENGPFVIVTCQPPAQQ